MPEKLTEQRLIIQKALNDLMNFDSRKFVVVKANLKIRELNTFQLYIWKFIKFSNFLKFIFFGVDDKKAVSKLNKIKNTIQNIDEINVKNQLIIQLNLSLINFKKITCIEIPLIFDSTCQNAVLDTIQIMLEQLSIDVKFLIEKLEMLNPSESNRIKKLLPQIYSVIHHSSELDCLFNFIVNNFKVLNFGREEIELAIECIRNKCCAKEEKFLMMNRLIDKLLENNQGEMAMELIDECIFSFFAEEKQRIIQALTERLIERKQFKFAAEVVDKHINIGE